VKVATGETFSPVIGPDQVAEYLGPAKIFSEIAERVEQAGVATGLAWTPTGGDILFIEISRMPGKGQLVLPGQLGAVMKESAQAALSYVRAHAADLGIPVANGYGLTEAGTAITVNDLRPFRADTVGKPLPGMEVRIVNPSADGIGEISVRSKTIMSGYLNEPELTAETIVDGWLMTGDLGRFDAAGHLQLFGRKKNMIVTEEGKNIYPEDIESVFESLPVKEFCVFAANYIWPQRAMVG